MGRRKIPMSLIENRSSRNTTFKKRKSGLFKKAMELSILTGAKIRVIVYDNDKLHEYGSEKDPLPLMKVYAHAAQGPHETYCNEDYMDIEGKLKPGALRTTLSNNMSNELLDMLGAEQNSPIPRTTTGQNSSSMFERMYQYDLENVKLNQNQKIATNNVFQNNALPQLPVMNGLPMNNGTLWNQQLNLLAAQLLAQQAQTNALLPSTLQQSLNTGTSLPVPMMQNTQNLASLQSLLSNTPSVLNTSPEQLIAPSWNMDALKMLQNPPPQNSSDSSSSSSTS